MITFKSYSLIILVTVIFPLYFVNADFEPISITSIMGKLPEEPQGNNFYIKQYADACFILELHKILDTLRNNVEKENKKSLMMWNAQNFMITISKLYKFMDEKKDSTIKESLFLAFKIVQGIIYTRNATESNYDLFKIHIVNACDIINFEERVGDIVMAARTQGQNVDQICNYLVNTIYTNYQEAYNFHNHLSNYNTYADNDFKQHLQQYIMSSNIIIVPNTSYAHPNDILREHYKHLLCIYRDFMETIKRNNGEMIKFMTYNNPEDYLSIIYEEFLTIRTYALWLQTLTYDENIVDINYYLDIDFQNYFTQFIEEYKDIENNIDDIDRQQSWQDIISVVSESGNMHKHYLFIELFGKYKTFDPNFEELNCKPFDWLYIQDFSFSIIQPEIPLQEDTYISFQSKMKVFKHRQMLSEYSLSNIATQAPE